MKGETSQIRFLEAQKLLDYGFNNYEYMNLSKKNDIVKSVNVDKGLFSNIEAVFEEDSGYLIKKGQSNNVSTSINLPNSIPAPIIKGQKIGEVTYSIDGNIIASTNIVSKNDVKKINFGNMSSRIIENWFTLFR